MPCFSHVGWQSLYSPLTSLWDTLAIHLLPMHGCLPHSCLGCMGVLTNGKCWCPALSQLTGRVSRVCQGACGPLGRGLPGAWEQRSGRWRREPAVPQICACIRQVTGQRQKVMRGCLFLHVRVPRDVWSAQRHMWSQPSAARQTGACMGARCKAVAAGRVPPCISDSGHLPSVLASSLLQLHTVDTVQLPRHCHVYMCLLSSDLHTHKSHMPDPVRADCRGPVADAIVTRVAFASTAVFLDGWIINLISVPAMLVG